MSRYVRTAKSGWHTGLFYGMLFLSSRKAFRRINPQDVSRFKKVLCPLSLGK